MADEEPEKKPPANVWRDLAVAFVVSTVGLVATAAIGLVVFVGLIALTCGARW